MNVLQAVRNYVTKMVNAHQGLKALVMDEETVRIVSVAFAKSELLKHECVAAGCVFRMLHACFLNNPYSAEGG
jgi:hypothetical protein